MLFAGELSPGEPLREVTLADGFQVARSTVREALQVLAGEGLVTRYPNRGVVVTELSRERHRRDLRGPAGARERGRPGRARRGGPVARSRRRWRRTPVRRQADDQVEATHAHLEFHTSLVALLGNARLVASADVLTGDLRLALASVERARRNARAQVADHRRLLTLMRSGERGRGAGRARASPQRRRRLGRRAGQRRLTGQSRSSTVPSTSPGATAPTCQESTPSTGLSRSTHQPSSSSRAARLTDSGRPGHRTTTSRPGRGRPPHCTSRWSPSRRVGSIERPRTSTRPERERSHVDALLARHRRRTARVGPLRGGTGPE